MSEFYNLGSQMRKLVSQHTEYQDKLEANMVEGLEEYSSIVHTLPVLVKMHEEAMACFNESKHKGSVCSCLWYNLLLLYIRKKMQNMLGKIVKH